MSGMSEMSVNPQQEYSTAEAGKILGLSSKQVGRLIDAGELAGRRLSSLPGSRRVVSGQAILDYQRKL